MVIVLRGGVHDKIVKTWMAFLECIHDVLKHSSTWSISLADFSSSRANPYLLSRAGNRLQSIWDCLLLEYSTGAVVMNRDSMLALLGLV